MIFTTKAQAESFRRAAEEAFARDNARSLGILGRLGVQAAAYPGDPTPAIDGSTYTVTNIGPAHAPEPPPKVADKPIHEMTLLDYQKACKAFFAPKTPEDRT